MKGNTDTKALPYNPTEIAAALRASQRREERRYVTNVLNEYWVFHFASVRRILTTRDGYRAWENRDIDGLEIRLDS